MGLESNILLDKHKVDILVAQMLPEELIRRVKMLPIKIEASQLYIAVTEPIDLPGIDEIKSLTGMRVRPVIVPKDELENVIKALLRSDQRTTQTIIDMTFESLSGSRNVQGNTADTVFDTVDTDEAPVISLVNNIILGAVSEGASDIHLEPQYPEMRVRYRINGILQQIATVPKQVEPAVVSRIKLLADMDIAECRRPQDGHISMNTNGKMVDLRISTVLTAKGEKVVIRILDQKGMLLGLKQLGMLPDQQKILESFIARPYGIILVTGPTGSGKTTTLYTALSQFDADGSNIVTVENPVEYQINNISQIQVNTNINFGFANALRAIVRQDPDIIMIGEIQDYETAEIAIQSALTGHLILSTLHTNDAPGAVMRLADMGVQPFLIASTVRGVIAQRLVRSICKECKELYDPSAEELQLLNLPIDSSIKLAKGKGCPICHNTGYGGRIGVFEIFEIDEGIRKLILSHASSSDIRQLAIEKGMKILSQASREKILRGSTTVEEVQRVIYLGEEE
ncbi:MAG: GspE/PulE family protein [Candidatus Poribacteria bacterium]